MRFLRTFLTTNHHTNKGSNKKKKKERKKKKTETWHTYVSKPEGMGLERIFVYFYIASDYGCNK
jgi:hypothetical protein